MKGEIIHIESISKLCEVFGMEKPTHPLISVMDVSDWQLESHWVDKKLTLGMYYISLKDKDCGIDYGRSSYDFDEGVLVFAAPNQLITIKQELEFNEIRGKIMFFHPNLIMNTSLGKIIDNYKFFSYDVHEALHLSDAEQKTVVECFSIIHEEIKGRIDNHSQTVIASSIELLLNLSNRYYERQFLTRSAQNSDIVSQFNTILKDYYGNGNFSNKGIPPIEYFSEKINLSTNYLSDLLKKETGFSAKEHINNFIIDKAKTLLLSDTTTINEIAYTLGFNYPHYFSRLFKNKTGLTPHKYRQLN
ncbi:helix-turn-helix domain-containing protein [Tenacibaculum sp. ZH5_bin.1]|uniref:helix-turn-helix domain-containing protein n=1 Tax=Tenacibaculum TaxID=104267 RepID=UPI0014320B75|nr:helix-turn-helix domain-containing protein [Tenacibaculum mesophilum]KAF9658491.1 AraC family transcriptional regulator [Tenacibaculum mesophilum]